MADEMTGISKSEPESVALPAAGETFSSRSTFITVCATALCVCFFLPWISVFRRNVSGFDLQKIGGEQRLLWLIPICCVLTIFAGITKRSQQIAAQLSGALPFLVGIYWYLKIHDDLFNILTYGGYLSLLFGACLLVFGRNAKK